MLLLMLAVSLLKVAATGTVCGSLSNPLLVLPLQAAVAREFPSSQKSAETTQMSNLVGAGYQAYEDSVLKKLEMV